MQIVVHVPETLPGHPPAEIEANQSRSMFLGTSSQHQSHVLLSVAFAVLAFVWQWSRESEGEGSLYRR